jgi:hypothetical protein
LRSSGIKDVQKVLSIGGSWSCLAKADPAHTVGQIVDALRSSGIKDVQTVLSNNSSWSCLANADDPAHTMGRIVDALRSSGIKDVQKVLSIGGSWSCLANADDPLVKIFSLKTIPVVYQSILTRGGIWSVITKFGGNDFWGQMILMMNNLHLDRKLLQTPGFWDRGGKMIKAYLKLLVRGVSDVDIQKASFGIKADMSKKTQKRFQPFLHVLNKIAK